MSKKELANKKVVKAISLGLATALTLMTPMTALAEAEAVEPKEEPVVEIETELPSVNEVVGETVETVEEIAEVPETPADPVETAQAEIDDLADAAGDVVIEIPLGFLGDIEIPVEPGVEIKSELAEDIIEDVDNRLEKAEEKVIDALDQSISDEEGKPVDVENDAESPIDDKTIDSLNKADGTLDKANGIIGDALAKAESAEENGIKTSDEAKALYESLSAAKGEAEIVLASAKMDFDEANKNYLEAKKAYIEASKKSNKEAWIAKQEMDAAESLVNQAAARAEHVNNQITKINNFLDKAESFIDKSQENIDEAIEVAEGNLDNALENLDNSIEKLVTADGEFKTEVGELKEELAELKEATGKFVGAVKDSYYSQKDLDELYNQYAEAQDAFEKAQKALEEAETNYNENGGKDAYDAALAAFTEADLKVQGLQEAYNKLAAFNDDLAGKITEGNFDAATQSLVEKYVADTKNGQTAEIVTDGSYGKYGEDDNAAYVVVKNSDGTVAKMYAYEITDDNFVVKELKTETPDAYYVIGQNEDGTDITKNLDELEVKGSDGDLYYLGEGLSSSSESTGKVDTISVRIPEVRGLLFGTVLYPGRDYGTYKYSDLPDAVTALGTFKYFNYEPLDALDFFGLSDGITCYVDAEGKVFTIQSVRTKVGSHKGLFGITIDDYEYIPTAIYDNDFLNYNSTQGTKTVATINGEQYDVTGNDTDGYTAVKGDDTVTLVKEGDTFFIKNSVTKVLVDAKDKVYTLSGEEKCSSNAVGNELATKAVTLEEEQVKLDEADALYKNKKATYDEYVSALDALVPIKAEAERTDLTVKRDINILGYKDTIEYGNLADLPRSVLDLISIDNVLNMSKDDQSAVVDALGTIVKPDAKDTEKLAALVGVIKNMGGTDLDAYTALMVALGSEATSEKLDEILENVEKIPVAGEWFADEIRGLVKDNKAVTEFQEDYAKAWKKALDAKVDVVLSGVNLAKETGDTVQASIDVLKAGVVEGAAITDVTLNALNVAINGAALGGLRAADQVAGLSKKLVSGMNGYVDALNEKTQKAADEAKEAQEAVNKLTITRPGSEELAQAKAALDAARKRLGDFRSELRDARKDLKTLEEKANEADDLAKKLAEEEAAKRRAEEERRNESQNNDEYTGEEYSEPTADTNVLISNAVVITEDDLARYAQAIADQAVLGANRNRVATKKVTVAAADEAEEAAPAEEKVAAPVKEVEEVAETPEEDIKKVVEIEDTKTALAGSLTEEEKAGMNWWWLLIVAVLGATGVAMYRNSQKKKAAAQTTKSDK